MNYLCRSYRISCNVLSCIGHIALGDKPPYQTHYSNLNCPHTEVSLKDTILLHSWFPKNKNLTSLMAEMKQVEFVILRLK